MLWRSLRDFRRYPHAPVGSVRSSYHSVGVDTVGDAGRSAVGRVRSFVTVMVAATGGINVVLTIQFSTPNYVNHRNRQPELIRIKLLPTSDRIRLLRYTHRNCYTSLQRYRICGCIDTYNDLASPVQGAKRPSSASAEGASREDIQRPSSVTVPLYGMALLPRRSKEVVRCSPWFRRCSNVTRSVQRRLWPSVESRCGTLRTTCKRKSPAESGATVVAFPVSSDGEIGSPDLNKRGPSRPERGRSG